MSWYKDKKRNNPADGEGDALPCPAPENCKCVWTYRNHQWVKGDDHADCPVHGG